MRQASRDIDSVYSMGLFDDVNILPQAAEDSTPGCPKVRCNRNSRSPVLHATLQFCVPDLLSLANPWVSHLVSQRSWDHQVIEPGGLRFGVACFR